MIPATDAELITDFRSWLATRDPLEEYIYTSNSFCCFAQYLRDRGVNEPRVSPYSFADGKDWRDLPVIIEKAVCSMDDDCNKENIGQRLRYRTFGNTLHVLDQLILDPAALDEECL
jgi:hypothetical protein